MTWFNAMAAVDKRGETGVLSNTDVHYYGAVLLSALAVMIYDNTEKSRYEMALTFVFCRLLMSLLQPRIIKISDAFLLI